MNFLAELKDSIRKQPRSFAYAMFWVLVLIGMTVWNWNAVGWWSLLILAGCLGMSYVMGAVQRRAIRRDEADQ